MDNHCKDPWRCPGGTCEGCRDGIRWCQDPACAPYCQGCAPPVHYEFVSNIVIGFIALCLLGLLAIVWIIYGPSFFNEVDSPYGVCE